MFFRCLAACCGSLLADDVYLRVTGDRNATIVAFVRDCLSEATTRPGTSSGTGRQGRSLHAGKVGARVVSAWPVNESCVPAETGYVHRPSGVLVASILPPAVPRVVAEGWGDGGSVGVDQRRPYFLAVCVWVHNVRCQRRSCGCHGPVLHEPVTVRAGEPDDSGMHTLRIRDCGCFKSCVVEQTDNGAGA